MISFENSMLLTFVLLAATTLSGIFGLVLRLRWLRITATVLAALSFILQSLTISLAHTLTPGILSFGDYTLILSWFVLLCAFFGLWKTRHTTIVIFLSPISLVIYLVSLLLLKNEIVLPQSLSIMFFAFHIGVIFLSLALITLAAVAGILFLYVERKIKTKSPLKGFRKDFPALKILDKINAIAIQAGFPLFSVGIICGLIWANYAWGTIISGDPKEVVSLMIWAIFAWLFHIRVIQGRGGRKPAILILILFTLNVFSILVVNTFMDTHHSFIRL